MNKINRIGNQYGRLLVVSEAEKKGSKLMYNCICDCGNKSIVASGSLSIIKSCGCLTAEIASKNAIKRNTVHGHNKAGLETPTHRTWVSMITRCKYTKHNSYNRYGGRGITVCERWTSFENFLSDMGVRPEGKTLDRIDVNADYNINNCRWATNSEQQRNRVDSTLLTINGETKQINDWADLIEWQYVALIRSRISRGWSNYDAVYKGKR